MNTICKSKILVWLMVMCMLAGMFVTTGMPAEVYADGDPWLGSGTSEEPYKIEDSADLITLSNPENKEYWGAYFEQSADITLEGESNWVPIGNDTNKFTGTYDGGNNTIYNLTVKDDSDYIGLFGVVEGTVKNLYIDEANIISEAEYSYTGGFAGLNSGKIINCHFNGNISGAAYAQIGGIAGMVNGDDSCSISECSSSGKISGGDNAYYLGGIVGFNYKTISDCWNNATITAGDNIAVGGIAGAAGTVENCYNTGDVSGGEDSYVGGVAGRYTEVISNCYNTGNVAGGANAVVGGVAGSNGELEEISNCYNTGNVTGGDNAIIGGAAGYNSGEISNCYNTGNVSCGDVTDEGDYGTGGLVGINDADISDCYNTGNVVGGNVTVDRDSNLGGLVGLNDDNGEISNCYNTGNVSGANIPCEGYYSNLSVGGLAGANSGEIDRSNSTGDVTGGNATGGLVGLNEGSITNSNSDCNISITNNEFVIKMVGGLAGVNDDNITDCYSKGSVRIDDSAGGYLAAGGLIGYSTGTVISCYSSCSANMSVQINEEGIAAAGGLIGQAYNGIVTDCYSTGSVGMSGTFNGLYIAAVGGLIGINEQPVENCYSVGFISNGDGVTHYGGLIGYNDVDADSIISCYYDSITSGQDDEGKGIPKTTAEMMKQETFEGWDFENSWYVFENSNYPAFRPLIWNGDGSEKNPYLVEFPVHLKEVRNKIEENGGAVYFRQTADITLNTPVEGESNWVPIGDDGTKFKGTYDGGGFKISNLTIADSDERYAGLFGYVDNGTLNDIHLDNVNITGNNYIGGLIGFNCNGTVDNCSSEGNISGGINTGGLVGYNYGTINSSLSNCNVNANTDSHKYVGGLTGYNDGSIIGCFSKGSVNVNETGGSHVYAGGLTGGNDVTVTDCYSTCSVNLGGNLDGETIAAGGLIAYNWGDVENSYSTGSVTTLEGENRYCGGLVAYYHNGNITGSYYDSTTSGHSDDEGKGIPKTTDDLMKKDTFEGWDFKDTWYIKEGKTYPDLLWNRPAPQNNRGGNSGSRAPEENVEELIPKTFSDLTDVEWARNAIETLATKGIISGTGENTYSPNLNITRADYLMLLLKTLRLTADFDNNFSDVAESAYYYDAVGAAKELGIASGDTNGLFNPMAYITRQDMMVLTARALEKFKGLEPPTDYTVLDRFDDKGNISDYALSSIAALVGEGLIAGSENLLNPLSNTTRAEAAVFLYNIYNRY